MRILIAEGNMHASRQRSREIGGSTPGEGYGDVITALCPSIEIDIYNLPDAGEKPPKPIDVYDGIVLTGSSLTIYEDRPEVRRQIEFAQEVFACGVPFFGSCWGLQVATVAAGGEVLRNQRGREVGFARAIRLTSEGISHPLHDGRPVTFDAPAVHADHVTRPADGTIVTASNSVSDVQAAEISYKNGTFWGVQYHPEFSLKDIADVLVRYAPVIVDEEKFFEDPQQLAAYAGNLRLLHDDRERRSISWQYAIGKDLLDDRVRLTEIANWLRVKVGAAVH